MSVKNFRVLLIVSLVFLCSAPAWACMSRILYVGALDNAEQRLLAEVIRTLINERTGTTVKIRYFENSAGLYQALRSNDEAQEVDIVVEDTATAANVLKMARLDDPDLEYATIKKRYEQELGLIWLSPFGFTRKGEGAVPAVAATLVRGDVLDDFPLLPRVLNKLAGTITDEVLAELLARVTQGGEKPKNVARDFLRVRNLI